MTRFLISRALGVPLIALLVFGFSGCDGGALGGGGTIEPTVRVLVDPQAADDGGADDDYVPEGYGTFTGRVVLAGDPPAVPSNLPPGTLKDAAICIRADIPNDTFVWDPNTRGIRDVFVFLARKPRGTPSELAEPPPETVYFDQKICTFVPHAMVLQAGQEMRIKNSDGVVHNTNISGVANGNFNSAVSAHESVGIPYVYARGETSPVRVGCDFHPWMLAWHLPLDHPYGDVTVENEDGSIDGSFLIENIPSGSHQFVIYHGNRKVMDFPVTIEPDGVTEVEIPIAGEALLGQVGAGETRSIMFSFAR